MWTKGDVFDGTIDDARVYDRALSEAEVKALDGRPVGRLRFDEGARQTAGGSSGFGSPGTLVDGPAWVNGRPGKALDFDGAGDYVSIPTSATLEFNDAITVAAWIKTDTVSGDHRIVKRNGGSGTYQWVLVTEGDQTTFDFCTDTWSGVNRRTISRREHPLHNPPFCCPRLRNRLLPR